MTGVGVRGVVAGVLVVAGVVAGCSSSPGAAADPISLQGQQLEAVRVTGLFAAGTPEGAETTFATEMTPTVLDDPEQWDAWMTCGQEPTGPQEGSVEENRGRAGSYQVSVSDSLRRDFMGLVLAADEQVEAPGEYAARLVFFPVAGVEWPEVLTGTMRIRDDWLGGDFEVADTDGIEISGTWECVRAG
ncbi:hypothetical protein [Nocardioides sp. AE5]|uniref:hypothetical protein n=1 Tax=Nocardioides sp. AE5 TaxID=2962573 RepID=UPI002880DB56|nr:hypothetical protein [Nocardioides sp. AE5]MDT0200854.1 hypothetical protein [Nocardioides sp. AE5]